MLSGAVHRIQSERGASMSMALFLFLVCTVVASVVLVAGTAASGRLANLADMDQRYYNVTSALQMIEKELNSSSSMITEELVYTETLTSSNPADTYTYKVVSDQITEMKGFSNNADKDISMALSRYLITGQYVSNSSTADTVPINGSFSVTNAEEYSEAEWQEEFFKWEDEVKADGARGGSLSLFVNATKGSDNVPALATLAEVKFDSIDQSSSTSDGAGRISMSNTSAGVTYYINAALVPEFDMSTEIVVTAVESNKTTYKATKTAKLKWSVANVTTGQI